MNTTQLQKLGLLPGLVEPEEVLFVRLPPTTSDIVFVQGIGRAKRDIHPSNACLDSARKLLGVKPYNESCNYLVGDGYFARDCRNKYGDAVFDKACEIVRNE